MWVEIALIIAAIGLVTGSTAIIFSFILRRKVDKVDRSTNKDTRNWEAIGRSVEELAKRVGATDSLVQAQGNSIGAIMSDLAALRHESSRTIGEVERRLASRVAAGGGPVVMSPESISARKDFSPEQAPVNATDLCGAVEEWQDRASKAGIDPPSQIAAKIEELRNFAAESKLSAGIILSDSKDTKWRDLAFVLVCLAADHTDQRLDPRREEPAWQRLLQRIISASRADELHPVRNDPVNELEHHSVGRAPRTSDDDLSYHVAYLRQRGFRMGGQVLRKAAVVVYE
jgi:hypothetical protein